MRDELTRLRNEFDETASLARSVLAVGRASEEGRIESAARRVAIPHLLILLVGGTQVGKSTLLNALAGQRLSEVGRGAATTQNAVFYAPEDVASDDLPYLTGTDIRVGHRVPGLAGKVIVDAPDCDSFRPENKQRSLELLQSADVVMVVTSWEKYNQLSLHAVLAPEVCARSKAAFVFVMNKMDELSDAEQGQVVGDFTAQLSRIGVAAPVVFPVSALQAFEERTRAADSLVWSERLASLERYLGERLDHKLKGANLARAMERGLDELVEGGQGGTTVRSLARFTDSVEVAEVEFRKGVTSVVTEVLDAHRSSFLTTLRGIAGERLAGGFGAYLSALTYLRPSRVSTLLKLPGQRSGEEALLDVIATSLSGRLARRLVDGLAAYFRRLRAAAKDLRENVPLADTIRADLDVVGAEPMLAPDALFGTIRPALDSLSQMEIGGVASRAFNLPCFLLVHTAPLVLIYQYLAHLDPARVVMWVVTLPFVLLSILEVERFLFETLWLSRVVGRRIEELTARLEQSVMQAVGEGALVSPRRAQAAIRALLERHRQLVERLERL